MRIVRMLGGPGNCGRQSRRLGGSGWSWSGCVREGWRMLRDRCMFRWMGRSMFMYLALRRRMSGHVNQLGSSPWRGGGMQCGNGWLGKGWKRRRARGRGSHFLFRSGRCLCRGAAYRRAAGRGGGVLGRGIGCGWHRRSSSPRQVWAEACAMACACFNSLGSCRLNLRNSLATPASK